VTLVVLLFVGNRYGKDVDTPRDTGHSVVMSALGVLLFWTGWYGFNVISLQATRGRLVLSSRSAITHSLASSVSACTQLILQSGFSHFNIFSKYPHDMHGFMNAVIGGSVAIAAGSHTIDPAYAMIVGIVASITVFFTSKMLRYQFRFDDTTDSVACHGACGVVGLWMAGLLSSKENVDLAYDGLINFSAGRQFGVQILGSVVIIAWAAGSTYLLLTLATFVFKLRVSHHDDAPGNDFKYFSSYAYPDFEEKIQIAKEHFATETAMRNRVQKEKFEQIAATSRDISYKERDRDSKEKEKSGKERSKSSTD